MKRFHLAVLQNWLRRGSESRLYSKEEPFWTVRDKLNPNLKFPILSLSRDLEVFVDATHSRGKFRGSKRRDPN